MAAGQASPNSRPTSYIPHPKAYAEAANGPYWGCVAAAIGGIAIILEGLGIVVIGSAHQLLLSLAFGLSPVSEALTMLAVGSMVLAIGVVSYHAPSEHRIDGAMIWLAIFGLGLTETVAGYIPVIGVLLIPGAYFAMYGAHQIWSWKPHAVGGPEAIQRAAWAARKGG